MSAEAREFLDRIAPFYGSDWLNLVAIDPAIPRGLKSNLVSDCFAPSDRAGQIKFVEQHRSSRNLYYALNPVREKKRAKKEGVSFLVAIGVDADPLTPASQTEDNERTRDAFEGCPLRPTSIVDSGRGLQALWYLDPPIHVNGNIDELESAGKHLDKYFRALGIPCDSMHSLEHIYRLPGTINHLNAKKREKGFTEARPTGLLDWSGKLHDFAAFANLKIPESTATPRSTTAAKSNTNTKESTTTESKTKKSVATQNDVAEDDGQAQAPVDWSADLAKQVRGLVMAGYGVDEIRSICGGHRHLASNPDPERALQRCLKLAHQALAEVGEDFIGVHPWALADFKQAPWDVVILPNDYVPYSVAGLRIGRLMAKRQEAFARDGCVVELNNAQLEVVAAQAFRSRIERRRRIKQFKKIDKVDQLALVGKRCSVDTATALLATNELIRELPPIGLVANAPVLIEHDNELLTLGKGYYRQGGGVLVLSGETPPTIDLKEAVHELLGLLIDYIFTTPADRSRAVAALLGPTLRMGHFIKGHALMLAVESQVSQSGKGHFSQLVLNAHNEDAHLITIKEGGVGSFDESLGKALISGKPFIRIDNVRSRFPSQNLEGVITAYGAVEARVPYHGVVMVDASAVTLHLTSNGIEMTSDLANRCMIVRLKKQPPDYRFKTFPENWGLLAHVKAKQSYYAGCIFAVLRKWHAEGKPALETPHTFHEWVGALDWIVRNIFDLPPLMDGHQEAVERTSDKGLSWLRLIAIKALDEWPKGEAVSASALVTLSERAAIELPGSGNKTEVGDLARLVGSHMARCFKDGDERLLDSIRVRRTKVRFHDVAGRPKEQPQYQFWKDGGPVPPIPRGERCEIEE